MLPPQQYLHEGTPLVDSLMTMTRELRHTGIRIVISTQGGLILVGLGMNVLLTHLQNRHVFHPSCLTFVGLPSCTGSPAPPGGITFRSIFLASSPLVASRRSIVLSSSKPGRPSSFLRPRLPHRFLHRMERPPCNLSDVGISLLVSETG